MGKAIIVKGADFSQNGISPYNLLFGITNEEFEASTTVVGTGTQGVPYIYAEALSSFSGVTKVYGIKLKAARAGIIPIYTGMFSANKTAGTDITFVENLQITEDMVDSVVTLFFSNPITITSGKKVILGYYNSITMTASWYFGGYTAHTWISMNRNASWTSLDQSVCVDYLVEKLQ